MRILIPPAELKSVDGQVSPPCPFPPRPDPRLADHDLALRAQGQASLAVLITTTLGVFTLMLNTCASRS